MVLRKGDPCPLVEDGKVCGEPIRTRGWCGKHYARFLAHDDPLYPVRPYVRQGAVCAHPGCGEKPKYHGLCDVHVRRQVKHGETTDPRERRFWRKVNKNGPIPAHRPDLGPCWEWTGYVDPNGYGQYGGAEGTRLPHRIAYEYLVGPVPPGLHVDHVCRNRKCVNAAGGHLEPVTPRENIERGDQGAFWGYVPDPIPAKPKALKPTFCTKCGRTDKPVYKSGLCRPCYRKRTKDPNRERPELLSIEERFWSKVDKTGSCWLWTGSVNQGTGYGQFSPKHGFQVQTHRYSYEMAKGPIPAKHDIHHTCHVRRCCNPAHLIAATRSENMKLRKNRRDT